MAAVCALAACGGSSTHGGQDDAGPGKDGPAQTDGAVPSDGPAQADGAKGHAGSGAVVGAVSASSASYKLIGTVTSGRGTAGSATYKYRGGVVGSTQKP